jgi:hypothetical protein
MVEVPGNTCNEYDDIFIICTSRTIKNGGFTTFIMTNPAVKTKSPIFLPTEEKIVVAKMVEVPGNNPIKYYDIRVIWSP